MNTVPKHGARSPDPAMVKVVLSSSANKANLLRFLVTESNITKLREKLRDKQIYVASQETCLYINNDQ